MRKRCALLMGVQWARADMLLRPFDLPAATAASKRHPSGRAAPIRGCHAKRQAPPARRAGQHTPRKPPANAIRLFAPPQSDDAMQSAKLSRPDGRVNISLQIRRLRHLHRALVQIEFRTDRVNGLYWPPRRESTPTPCAAHGLRRAQSY